MKTVRKTRLLLRLVVISGLFFSSPGVSRPGLLPGGSGETSVPRFEKSPQTFPVAATYQIQLGDLDGDGDLDAVFANMGFNDGRGRFSDGWTQPDTALPYGDAAFGDFDGDGDQDAIIAQADNDSRRPTVVLLNDGKGRFSDSGQKLLELPWGRLALIDVNRDGALDILVCQYHPRMGGQPPTFWLNDGQGRFRESGVKLGADAYFTSGTTGDLDGDSDLDLFLASFSFDSGSPAVWFNRQK